MKKRLYILLLGLVAGITSCTDWLDVQPKTSIPVEKLFESEAGFKDVLTGFYLKMGQTNLYAKNLTYGYLDAISGNYDEFPGVMRWREIYDYDNTWSSVKDGVYTSMYNVIANINNFLKYIDKNRSVIKTEKYYELMKGEALGLRAFLHFDLLRLYGPVYSVTPTGKAIPYRTSFDQKATPVLPAEKVIEHILTDLHEADSLLEISDPKNFDLPEYYSKDYNAFEDSRQLRMNTCAVKAMLARVYCYKGDAESKRKALTYAYDVVESNYFALYEDNSNPVLFAEHIFGLNVYELDKLLEDEGNYKTRIPEGQLSDGVYIMRTKANFDEHFETGSRGTFDIRANTSAFKNVAGNGSKEYKLCLKYDQSSYTSNASKYYGKDVLPLIRLPEMYYIIAECETDKSKSAEALNTVMWTRGIAYEDGVVADDDYNRLDTRAGYDPTHTKRVNELMKEYRKEFFSEGQLFYFYKRHNYKTFPYCVKEDMSASYQWPLPDNEKTFGNNN